MRCIFCLNDRPGTEEHVFPRAIGGRLITDRVCMPCNSALGNKVDVELCDNYLVRGHRARLKLAGNSGVPPPMHEGLLGVGRLADNPNQRVEITFDETTQKIVMRALYHSSDVIMPDGREATKIWVDEKDVGDLPKIIQRERKRRGLRPLSSVASQEVVKKLDKNLVITENPKILFERSYSFAFVPHAFCKIAYELAFLWLGEKYLDDPSADEWRRAICAGKPDSIDRLPAYFGSAEGFEAFRLWPTSETTHLAYAFGSPGGIAIAVRVFDIHAALVWVTNQPGRYLSGEHADQKLRFLNIDTVAGQMRNVALAEEVGRIAGQIVANRKSGQAD